MEKKFNRFSVPLGLLDYVNPILYSITMYVLIKNMYHLMAKPFSIFFLTGAIISVFFGLIIPTGKVIVGLGILPFVMPVSLVFCVNTGILMTGITLMKHVMKLNAVIFTLLTAVMIGALILVYRKSRKVNTVAVLTGAAGYLLIYISLITLSLRKGAVLPVILYAAAIALFVMLCTIGIKANLKNPKVHWVIEISNVICQLCVAAATVILFGG